MKVAFAAIAVVIFLLFIFLISYKPEPKEFVTNRTFLSYSDLLFNYEVSKYPSSVQVSSVKPTQEKITLGVVTDPWNLNFGIIPAGNNSVKRLIDLVNKKGKDAKVNLKAYGSISPFVIFSKNNFFLHPKENISVGIDFYAASAKIGNYSGEIDVIVQRPKYDFLYNFWR